MNYISNIFQSIDKLFHFSFSYLFIFDFHSLTLYSRILIWLLLGVGGRFPFYF